ncbi:serine/threonine protein kinase [bacterium]|nr:serine/threonine protein kinase [bacterium]
MSSRRDPAGRSFESTLSPPNVPPWRGEILIVTQDTIDRDGLVPSLCAGGFAVRTCRPKRANLGPTLLRPPSLLLLDLAEDHELVLEFARSVRDGLGERAPAAIALAGDDETTFERAFSQGVADVLAKPAPSAVLRVKAARLSRPRSDLLGAVGGYRVKRILGRGGMGTVYLAQKDGKEVALKVLDTGSGDLEPEALARFRRETDMLRSLEGSRIPRFLDAGRVADCFYFAMEFVPGETLRDAVSRGPIGERATARIIDHVGEALETIHRAGLVHRDVKPANVILVPGGGAKLVDFGLAKAVSDHGLTRTDQLLGTLHYLAPELVLGQEATPRTDAFALGMTALEALVGSSPLVGSSEQIAAMLAEGDFPRARDLVPTCAPQLRAALDGLLEPAPHDRASLSDARQLVAMGGPA